MTSAVPSTVEKWMLEVEFCLYFLLVEQHSIVNRSTVTKLYGAALLAGKYTHVPNWICISEPKKLSLPLLNCKIDLVNIRFIEPKDFAEI